MKKLGKKISYITKVLLVIGLIISNLSSLTVVFANELPDEPNLEVNQVENLMASMTDNQITISYIGEVLDENELVIHVEEKYTYANCTITDEVLSCDENLDVPYQVDDENKLLLLGDGMVINYTPSMLSQVNFDGAYELTVSLIDVSADNTLLGQKTLMSENNTFSQGMEFKLYDQNESIIEMNNGVYVIPKETLNVSVAGRMLAGGISPNDQYMYDDNIYTADQILDVGFMNNIDLSNHLYGKYKLPLEFTYVKNDEEKTYTNDLDILYGTYEDNAQLLNSQINSSNIVFNSTASDGYMYIYLSDSLITINDIYQALNGAYGASENIEFVIGNADFSIDSGGIISGYDPMGEETLEEYLSKIPVDSSTLISISDGFATITYQALAIGDFDGDNALDENDVVALIDQLVGNEPLDTEKSNVYDSDDEVTVLDVMELVQIINTGTWYVPIVMQDIELDAKLELEDETAEIQSGNEFEINYVLNSENYDISGIAGNITYDDTKLELISITKDEDFIGNNKDGKFVYVNPSYQSSSSALLINSNISTDDGIFLRLKFRALSGGVSTVTIESPEYFNEDKYYNIVELDSLTDTYIPTTNVISIDVTVEQSSDNTLSMLKIGDTEISLVDDVYDYQLTVPNDVTTLNITALASNVAASVSSIVAPEKLAEGENTITITVVSETNEVKNYTITVIREKATPLANNNTLDEVSYQETTTDDDNKIPTLLDEDKEAAEENEKGSALSKVIIIVLTLLAVGGLVYLIFKDDDSEAKDVNKSINRFKKDDFDPPKNINKKDHNKKNQNKNNKKER